MKKDHTVALTALAGGAAAFALRFAQVRTGFEQDTGLPVPGNFFAAALPAVFAVLAAALVLLTRRLPAETGDTPRAFSGYFSAEKPAVLSLLVAGAFLWGVSGGADILSALSGASGGEAADAALPLAAAPQLNLLRGGLTMASAGALFFLCRVCRRGEAQEAAHPALSGNLLLAAVGCLLVRLVLVYREDSVEPALASYYVEILALVFLILALYRASSFAFHCGQTRRFSLYASCALVLCAAALADRNSLAEAALYLGGVLLMSGFLLMRSDA